MRSFNSELNIYRPQKPLIVDEIKIGGLVYLDFHLKESGFENPEHIGYPMHVVKINEASLILNTTYGASLLNNDFGFPTNEKFEVNIEVELDYIGLVL